MTMRLIRTELTLLAREPLTLVVSLAFPVLLLLLLAQSFGNAPDPDMGGIGSTDFYTPVYLSATVAVMGLMGVPTQVAAYRERGVLRRFRAAGVPSRALVLAQIAVTVVLALVGAILMVVLARYAFDLNLPTSWVGTAVSFLIGASAFAALGVLLGVLLSTARSAQGLGLALFFGLFFIAGGGPPPYVLPDAINTFVDLTPMGWLVDAVSDPWHGNGWNPGALSLLAAMGALSAVLSTRLLRRT